MVSLVEITGPVRRADGGPASGRIIATLSAVLENGVTTISPGPVEALVIAGQIVAPSQDPFMLAATDDAGTTPGGAVYVFTVLLDDAPAREFSSPVRAGGALAFTDLEPVAV